MEEDLGNDDAENVRGVVVQPNAAAGVEDAVKGRIAQAARSGHRAFKVGGLRTADEAPSRARSLLLLARGEKLTTFATRRGPWRGDGVKLGRPSRSGRPGSLAHGTKESKSPHVRDQRHTGDNP